MIFIFCKKQGCCKTRYNYAHSSEISVSIILIRKQFIKFMMMRCNARVFSHLKYRIHEDLQRSQSLYFIVKKRAVSRENKTSFDAFYRKKIATSRTAMSMEHKSNCEIFFFFFFGRHFLLHL